MRVARLWEAGAGEGGEMPQLARLNGGAPSQGQWVLIHRHETRSIQAAAGGAICKRYFRLWLCPWSRETPLIWRHVTIIPQQHISTRAGRVLSLGALDIAQSSGEVFIHHTANVPLEIGEKDTAGIPFSFNRALCVDGGLRHVFHGDLGESLILDHRRRRHSKMLWPVKGVFCWLELPGLL